jgi:catechol 2,3-dioxygenase-like lactoylglutathione lyase family enzyme/predicted N-acetyltransferase YhbS
MRDAGLLHHVELYVSDLKQSSAFWGWLLDWLGYEPYQQWEGGRSWRKGPTYLVLVQAESAYVASGYHRKRVGLNHLAFHATSRAQVDHLTAALRKRGFPVLYEDRHPYAGGPDHYAVFFEDPDRIKVEVVAPAGQDLVYTEQEGLPEQPRVLQGVAELHRRAFRVDHELDLQSLASERSGILLVLAWSGEQIVGFKIGYRHNHRQFYSWLGAVHPAYRRRGIASELMRRQHAWAAAQGYRVVRTKTMNQYRDMLVLNLRHGFDILGAYTDRHGEPKLILERDLRSGT